MKGRILLSGEKTSGDRNQRQYLGQNDRHNQTHNPQRRQHRRPRFESFRLTEPAHLGHDPEAAVVHPRTYARTGSDCRADVNHVRCTQCNALYMNPCYSSEGFSILFAQAGMTYGATEMRKDGTVVAW